MSLTYAAQQAPNSARKTGTIAAVVLLHVGLFYGLTHGLKIDLVEPFKKTVVAFIPVEIPPPPKVPIPTIKPAATPIDKLVTEVPTPIELPIAPEVPTTVASDSSAVSTATEASDSVAPARSFSITQRVNPQYPSASRRAGESGTVLLDIVVGPDGVPTEINVERSSGFQALDQSAVAAVRKWRFTVSSDTNYARVRLPVTFKLETVR
ncbi:MAG: energy transducer TonB [Steroidobacteraceae bacterium]